MTVPARHIVPDVIERSGSDGELPGATWQSGGGAAIARSHGVIRFRQRGVEWGVAMTEGGPPTKTQGAQLPFSSRRVQLEVLSDALQHPATLYPAGAAALAAIYGLLFGPFLGGSPAALTVAAASGVLAGGSFCWQYLINGERHARRKVQEFLAREAELGRQALEEERSRLQEGFSSLKSVEGRKALGELVREYTSLREALERYGEGDGIAAAGIAASALTTYREGLGVLASALDLMSATATVAAASLTEEVADLQRQIKTMRAGGAPMERIQLKEETLASHRGRLQAMEEQRLRVEELLRQADACEAALQQVRVQLPAMRADWSEEQADAASQSLLRTIESVRRVQERLGGEESRAQDEAYLRLGQARRDA